MTSTPYSTAPLTSSPAAWVGSWQSLLQTPISTLMIALQQHVPNAGPAQIKAWQQELHILQALAQQVQGVPGMQSCHVVLEYNLPREAGRRPDVLLLMPGQTVVLEFKGDAQQRRADLDQAYSYARDLREYHSAFVRHQTHAFLVLASAYNLAHVVDQVTVVSPDRLATALRSLTPPSGGSTVTPTALLTGVYSPLPSLVSAARCLFTSQPLPFIKRARSNGVSNAVQQVMAEAQAARSCGDRRLVLVTGVPGAGKTLIGLQVAHSVGVQGQEGITATFLSGNGPLVTVLQDALKSKAFVQDMHAFIREYGIQRPDRVAPEQILVFDEAQRAWDQLQMEAYCTRRGLRNPHASEPDLLVQIAEKLNRYAIILALVGSGQEIYKGEGGGIGLWSSALLKASKTWQVVGPPCLKSLFTDSGLSFREVPHLNLNTSLRFHAADTLASWVSALIDNQNPTAAKPQANLLRQQGYPIYLTRDLKLARGYVKHRFLGETDRRYGLLTSSKAKLLQKYGPDPSYEATRQLLIGQWFNAAPNHPQSCCQLKEVVTEFQCQGLELDFTIVCWDSDLRWSDGQQAWISAQTKPDPLMQDPHQLRLNTYRVLLTRGREGVILFVPPDSVMDETYALLVKAGCLEAAVTK